MPDVKVLNTLAELDEKHLGVITADEDVTGAWDFQGGLNLSGLSRPPAYETLISLFVPIGVFLLLVSIGLGMRFSSVRKHLVEGAAMFFIKFLILPVVAGAAAYMLGFHEIQDGLPMKIVMIASSMPVAFNAIVVTSIYDLDLHLANSCWIITTGSLLLVLPWLHFLFSLF